MSLFDWIVIALYLTGTIILGLWVSKKQENLKDFFLGGRSIPWWAALLSMVATEISAATFLGAPEQGYIRDMTYMQFSIGTVLARFVIAAVFLGVFYRFQVYTIYGYLTHRFGAPTHTSVAGVFLLGRLFASGARLFIASIAINVATGLDMTSSIIILAIVAIAYTWLGGIKAVIWTDVAQAVILVGGGIITVLSLISHIPLSFSEIIDQVAEAGKFRVFDFRWTTLDGGSAALLNPYHFIPAVIGGFFLTMATHGTDHDMVQRLLTCKNSKEGKRSLWMSGFLSVMVALLFIFIGQLLVVYVTQLPVGHHMVEIADQLRASGKNGHFFLHYIVEILPMVITGLVLASVFAAAMSSLDSALNAMSATVVTDFYKPYFRKNADSKHYLKVSRLATILIGALLVGAALLVVYYYEANPETDLLSIALGVMTLFYGALLGIFLIGLLMKSRGSTVSNIVGMALSIIVIILIKYNTSLAWPWFIVIGTLITFIISFLGRTASVIVRKFELENNSNIEMNG